MSNYIRLYTLTPRPRVKWMKTAIRGLKYKRSADYYFSFLTQDTITTTLETTFDAFSERTVGLPHAIYELASDRLTPVASDV